jgi:hypothetical protein
MLPLTLGANIGTTVTGPLAALLGNANGTVCWFWGGKRGKLPPRGGNYPTFSPPQGKFPLSPQLAHCSRAQASEDNNNIFHIKFICHSLRYLIVKSFSFSIMHFFTKFELYTTKREQQNVSKSTSPKKIQKFISKKKYYL